MYVVIPPFLRGSGPPTRKEIFHPVASMMDSPNVASVFGRLSMALKMMSKYSIKQEV